MAAAPAGQGLPTQDRDGTRPQENSIGNPDLSSRSYLEGLMGNRWRREEQADVLTVYSSLEIIFQRLSTCKKSPPLKFSSALSTKHRMLLPWKRWMKLLSFSPPTPASALPGNTAAHRDEMPAWGGRLGRHAPFLSVPEHCQDSGVRGTGILLYCYQHVALDLKH